MSLASTLRTYFRTASLAVVLCFGAKVERAGAAAAPAPAVEAPPPVEATPPAPPERPIYIQEYRVSGAKKLSELEVGEAVYPYLGPGRTSVDVEGARAAIEKLYKEKGFQTVSVETPQQQVKHGIVILKVVEAPVGQLRVHGSRYFSLANIKKGAPSVAEGNVPNFNDVTQDIVNLNQLSDRKITPSLRAGVIPGTVDIDLNVKDTFPLHGSVELNNRYSPDTVPLRLNASVSYNNLWQLGHSIGASYQIAPERPSDAKVFSAFYLARFQNISWLSLILQGTKQDSNVSTLGGAAVNGRGQIVGGRAQFTLPSASGFYHSVSLGLDYKHFDQDILLGTALITSPITYYPLSAAYSAVWSAKGAITELNAAVTFNVRGTGSNQQEFENSRFRSDGNFIYLRGDLSHTHDLPGGFAAYGKVQGQISGSPLVSSEQFSGGGLGTARGYLEGEVPGDNAVFGTLELRSPSLLGWWSEKVVNEWRVYAFADAGYVTIKDPLPEQTAHFELASVGIGTRMRVLQRLNGSLDAGVPLIDGPRSAAGDFLLTFRLFTDF